MQNNNFKLIYTVKRLVNEPCCLNSTTRGTFNSRPRLLPGSKRLDLRVKRACTSPKWNVCIMDGWSTPLAAGSRFEADEAVDSKMNSTFCHIVSVSPPLFHRLTRIQLLPKSN